MSNREVLFPRAVVCADNIRVALHGQVFIQYAESMVFAVKQYMTESLLSRGHDVIVDGTHTTRTSIRRNLELDQNAQFVLIDTPLEECKQRARAVGYDKLVDVIDRCDQQLRSLMLYGIDRTLNEIKVEIEIRKRTLW